RTWRRTSRASWIASSLAATKLLRCTAPTSPRRTARGGRSASRPSKDKVVPRAIAMVLEAVCEQDFLPCSYGFRPERSAHRALRQLYGVAAHAVCPCGPQVLVPCVFTLGYAVTGR